MNGLGLGVRTCTSNTTARKTAPMTLRSDIEELANQWEKAAEMISTDVEPARTMQQTLKACARLLRARLNANPAGKANA